jgi:hypothetical protein
VAELPDLPTVPNLLKYFRKSNGTKTFGIKIYLYTFSKIALSRSLKYELGIFGMQMYHQASLVGR